MFIWTGVETTARKEKERVLLSLLSFIPTLFPTPPPLFGMLYRLTKVPLNDATKLLNCVSRTGIYCNLNVTYLSEKRTLICFKAFYTTTWTPSGVNNAFVTSYDGKRTKNKNGTLWFVRSFLLLQKFNCYCWHCKLNVYKTWKWTYLPSNEGKVVMASFPHVITLQVENILQST